jgi:hypothetical protein
LEPGNKEIIPEILCTSYRILDNYQIISDHAAVSYNKMCLGDRNLDMHNSSLIYYEHNTPMYSKHLGFDNDSSCFEGQHNRK